MVAGCYMNDREIVIPEVEGKTIRSMRLILTGSTGETEVSNRLHRWHQLFWDCFARIPELQAELYVGGTGAPHILRKAEEERTWPRNGEEAKVAKTSSTKAAPAKLKKTA